MLHRQNAEKEGKKRELYFKPSPILREPPSEREKTLEEREEVLNTFTFSSAPDAILYLLSMLRHCMSYPCTCGRAISHQTGLWKKKKKTYIYINKAWIKRPQKLTLPEPAQISSALSD